MAAVASDISLKFLLPEIFIGLRSGCVAAAFMSVPETAVHKHHCSALREHKVGGTGQPPHMKSISKTFGEKKGAKYPFWPGVLSANARHHAAALLSGGNMHGLEYLPPSSEGLQKWLLRASAWKCEWMKATPEAAVRSLSCA